MFKIGDRIKVIDSYDANNYILNKTGTIVVIHNDKTRSSEFLIEFDEFINGHDGRNGYGTFYRGKKGHCWWLNSYSLRLSSNKFTLLDKINKHCEKIYRF